VKLTINVVIVDEPVAFFFSKFFLCAELSTDRICDFSVFAFYTSSDTLNEHFCAIFRSCVTLQTFRENICVTTEEGALLHTYCVIEMRT